MSELMKKYYKDANGELKAFKVYGDDEPLNCRKDWDNGDVLCLWWSNYALGDNEGKGNPRDILCQLVLEVIDANIDTDELSSNEILVMLQKETDKIVILPCFIYEHGGLSISCSNSFYPFNDCFDSGFAGFIYATRETIKVTGTPWYQVRDMLIEDVKTYDMYLKGQVYGWDSEDDSCWGYYSDKFGEELFNELACEAGLGDTHFYNEDEVEVIVTETRRLKEK